MRKPAFVRTLEGCLSLLLMVFVAVQVGAEVIYEDNFSPQSEEDWQFRTNVFVDDWRNWTAVQPPEGGDYVLVSTETNHFYSLAEQLQNLTDVEVTVLWLDVEIEDDIGRDADFGIELRVQPDPDDPDADATQKYGIEHDGDENDARNIADPPTHFHMAARGVVDPETGQASTITLDVVPETEMARPTGHVWYWQKFRAVGNHLSGKTWPYGTEEPPEYQLDAVDPDNNFPSGTIGLFTWSGTALVALIRVETIEAATRTWQVY